MPLPNGDPRPAGTGTGIQKQAGRATDSLAPPSDDFLVAWTAGYLAGWRTGQEVRDREINGQWPPPKVFTFGRWYSQAEERQKADAEVRRLVAEERAR